MAKRKRSRSRRRIFGINPGSVTEGFKPRVIRGILPMGIGAITNTFLTQAIARRIGFVNNNSLVRIGVGVLGAGLIGYAAGKVSKGDAMPAFLGAMTSTGIDAIGIIKDKYDSYAAPAPKVLTAPAQPGATTQTQAALPAPAAAGGVNGIDDINFSNDGTQGNVGELLTF